VLVVPLQDPDTEHVLKNCPYWKAQQKILGQRFGMRPRIDSRSGASLRTRCSQAVLDFLCTTNAGRLLFPNSAEEDDQSETSEWEHRERQEREEERRLEAEEAGAEVEERLRFFPTPSVMASAVEEWGVWGRFLLSCLSFVGGGQRGATASHLRSDRGRGRTGGQCAHRHVYLDRSHVINE